MQQLYFSRRAQGRAAEGARSEEHPKNAPVTKRPQIRQRSVVPGKVWVGGLCASTDAASLEAAFRPHGEVLDARVLYDGHGQERQSRGYGFVTFAEPESVVPAMRAMNGAVVDGFTVQVNEVFNNDAKDEQAESGTPVRKRSSATLGQQGVGENTTALTGSLTSTSASPVMMVLASLSAW